MNLVLKIVLSTAIAFLPIIVCADTTSNYNTFKTGCLEAAGGKEKKIKDVDKYHSYINKVCDCYADKLKEFDPNEEAPADAEGKIMVITGTCMATTYMTTVMNQLKNDTSLTVEKIVSTCDEENKSIYADQTPQDIELGKKLCICSANKIIILDKEKQTDPDTLTTLYIECGRQLLQ